MRSGPVPIRGVLPQRRASLLRLRPYQEEAVQAVLREWDAGRSTLLAMATGTGKTEVFLATLAREMNAGRLGRALIVAHRQELIDQPAERIARHFHMLGPVGIVQAGRDTPGMRVVIATVQTLTRAPRRERLLRAGVFSHLVIDEAHHANAATYRSLVDDLRAACPGLRILGTTATPRGGSGARGLHRVFQSVAFRLPVGEAIRAGALVSFRVFGVTLPVSFAGIRVLAGDYEDEAAGEVLSARNALALMVKTWRTRAEGRPTLAFTASVRQAHALADAFHKAGVEAQAVDGSTPGDERAAALARFRSGDLRVLANCQVFGEGVDLPHASCLLQARPTTSDSVYLQMLGRVLRPAPAKTDALILDFVPQEARDLVLAGDLLGKPREERLAEKVAREAGVVLESFAVFPDGRGVDAPPDLLRIRLLDYLARSPLAWSFDGGLATVGIGDQVIFAAQVLPSGTYAVYRIERWRAEPLGAAETWDDVATLARGVYTLEGEASLAMRRRGWRGDDATDRQKTLLRKWGRWRIGMTRGEAAQSITHEAARRALARRPREEARHGG